MNISQKKPIEKTLKEYTSFANTFHVCNYPIHKRYKFKQSSFRYAQLFMSLAAMLYKQSGKLETGDILTGYVTNAGYSAKLAGRAIKWAVDQGLIGSKPSKYCNRRSLSLTLKGIELFSESFTVRLNNTKTDAQNRQLIYNFVNAKMLGRVADKKEMAKILGWNNRRIDYANPVQTVQTSESESVQTVQTLEKEPVQTVQTSPESEPVQSVFLPAQTVFLPRTKCLSNVYKVSFCPVQSVFLNKQIPSYKYDPSINMIPEGNMIPDKNMIPAKQKTPEQLFWESRII